MKTNNDRIFVTGEGRGGNYLQQLNFLLERSLGNSTVRNVRKCFINFLKNLRTPVRNDLMVQWSRGDLCELNEYGTFSRYRLNNRLF